MSPGRSAAACVVALLLLVPAANAQAPVSTISVTGEGSLTAANDTARLGFGVEGRGATRPVALRRSSANLRRVLAALKGLGVADRDLRTRGVSVAPRRDRRGRKLPGYLARGGVTAVVRDVTRTGAVVDAAVAAGAASVDGPSFFIDDPQALLRRALVAAFRDARSKAAALAAEAGLTLGQTISIRESTFVPSETDFVDFDGGGGGSQERRASDPAPTEPGRTQIFGTVYVVFEAG
ncbi:MAG TPA: SIMPL domain-containing protein [Thermoleophilaceae bacterium]|nr:SIMPL domain-containing protein [Thermoleophilaceae bacterium]